jgi:hypothetical protein
MLWEVEDWINADDGSRGLLALDWLLRAPYLLHVGGVVCVHAIVGLSHLL